MNKQKFVHAMLSIGMLLLLLGLFIEKYASSDAEAATNTALQGKVKNIIFADQSSLLSNSHIRI